MIDEKLIPALRDYRYLLDRDYPQKSTIKLVGDKYQLTGEERSILYRGISSGRSAEIRNAKLSPVLQGENIYIDTYNILFTLANYLNGRPVFIADDGFLRDAGELRGRISKKKLLKQTVVLMEDFMANNRGHRYFLYLDQPVSNSGKLAASINSFLSGKHIEGLARTCDSPDFNIIREAQERDLVCTSDSVIIEKSKAPVYDLSRQLLTTRYQHEFVRLSDFL